jgi:hypothetical protein
LLFGRQNVVFQVGGETWADCVGGAKQHKPEAQLLTGLHVRIEKAILVSVAHTKKKLFVFVRSTASLFEAPLRLRNPSLQ